MKTGVIKRTSLPVSARFDASYHLSEGETVKRTINNSPYKLISVGDAAERIFYGARARRVYVSKKDHGIPFLSSSDILLSDLSNVKYVSKTHTPCIEDMKLQKGWVLISRSGTVGNCAYTNEKYAQRLASEDIIRLVPNNILRGGFVYAYLASKYGYSLLTQGTFGAVIQHIEPNNVAGIPIPVFPDDFQAKVDDLIQESSRLREEAADLLKKAKNMVEEFCNKPNAETTISSLKNISISKVRQSYNKRFDSSFFINSGVEWVNSLKRNTIRLGDCNIKLWYPGIFKRIYVNNGYPYIKGSDLFMTNPFRKCDYLSRTKTPILEQLWLKTRQILISCAGACGQVKLITKEYEDKNAIGSPDIIRMVSNDALFTTEYLFAYMQLSAVYQYMQSFKYGSVIERFDIANIANLPVVEPTKDLSETVTKIIQQYSDCTYKAFVAEETAISLVEKEIESWEK